MPREADGFRSPSEPARSCSAGLAIRMRPARCQLGLFSSLARRHPVGVVAGSAGPLDEVGDFGWR